MRFFKFLYNLIIKLDVHIHLHMCVHAASQNEEGSEETVFLPNDHRTVEGEGL